MTNGSERAAGGRILALDVGRRRIGLAVSDELGVTAQGLETLERTNHREDLAALARVAAQWNVSLLLVGHPVKLSGEEGSQAEWVRRFAEGLAAHTGLPVKLWDERLTTAEAERVLKQSGISIAKRARAIDRLAAVLLLQSYLDHRSHGPL
jgi:putative Holliday junction resolvase